MGLFSKFGGSHTPPSSSGSAGHTTPTHTSGYGSHSSSKHDDVHLHMGKDTPQVIDSSEMLELEHSLKDELHSKYLAKQVTQRMVGYEGARHVAGRVDRAGVDPEEVKDFLDKGLKDFSPSAKSKVETTLGKYLNKEGHNRFFRQ